MAFSIPGIFNVVQVLTGLVCVAAFFDLEASSSGPPSGDVDRAALAAQAEKTAAAHGVDAAVVDVDLLAYVGVEGGMLCACA